MIPDSATIKVEVIVSGKLYEKYISYCVEEFRKDEVPCSYKCEGANPGKIRNITQVRAHSAAYEEVPEGSELWKTIQYGARHKLGHGRGLCVECKKIGITAQSTPSPPRVFHREPSS